MGFRKFLSRFLGGSVCELLRKQDSYELIDAVQDDSEVRFLRWVRNGFFHGNEFHFDYEPKNAKCRGHEITRRLEGQPVFTTIKGEWWPGTSEGGVEPDTKARVELEEGYMEAGDAYALVSDVEETVTELERSGEIEIEDSS